MQSAKRQIAWKRKEREREGEYGTQRQATSDWRVRRPRRGQREIERDKQ